MDLNNNKDIHNEDESLADDKLKNKDEIVLTGACNSEAHSKVLVGEGQITSFNTFANENIIAYSEVYSNCVKIVRWASSSGQVTPVAKLPGI